MFFRSRSTLFQGAMAAYCLGLGAGDRLLTGVSGEMMPLECDIEETGSASAFTGTVSSVGTMGTASMASL